MTGKVPDRPVLVRQFLQPFEITVQTLLQGSQHQVLQQVHPRATDVQAHNRNHLPLQQVEHPGPHLRIPVQVLQTRQDRGDVITGVEVQVDPVDGDGTQFELGIEDVSNVDWEGEDLENTLRPRFYPDFGGSRKIFAANNQAFLLIIKYNPGFLADTNKIMTPQDLTAFLMVHPNKRGKKPGEEHFIDPQGGYRFTICKIRPNCWNIYYVPTVPHPGDKLIYCYCRKRRKDAIYWCAEHWLKLNIS